MQNDERKTIGKAMQLLAQVLSSGDLQNDEIDEVQKAQENWVNAHISERLLIRRQNEKICKEYRMNKKSDQKVIAVKVVGVRVRADGRYEGRYSFKGKNYSVFSKDRDECIEKLENLKKRLESNLPIRKYTFGDWLEVWIKQYKEPKIKTVSLSMIESCIRLHIPEYLKNRAVEDIIPVDIQKALNDVETSRVRKYVYNIYTDSFRRAFANRLIQFNPMVAIDPVQHHAELGKALSMAEQKKFLNDIRNTRCEGYFRFCLFSGARRSEALAVRYEDFDLGRNLIRIRGTKTEKSDRFIPLSEPLKKLYKIGVTGKLFDLKPEYVSGIFKEYLSTHKLHDLRHTFATRCLEMGVSMKIVQLWLGHSTYETTANIYTHVTDEYALYEAKKLDDIFKD